MIVYCIITAFINAVTSFVLGLAVMWRKTSGTIRMPFVSFAFVVAGWSAGYVLWLRSDDAESAVFWIQFLSAFAILVPSSFFHFVVRLTGYGNWLAIVVIHLVGATFAVLSFTPLVCVGVAPIVGFPFWPQAGPAYLWYVLFFFAIPIVSWVLLLIAWRRAEHSRRNQLKYIFVGTTIGFVGGGTNFPLWFGINIPPIGNGAVAIYVLGIAYAIIRFRLLEVNYVITKICGYLLIAVPVATVVSILLIVFETLSGPPGEAVFAWWVASLSGSFFSILLIPRMKQRMDAALERTMLKPFISGRDRLRELGVSIAGMRDEASMFRESVSVVSGAFAAGTVAYVRGELESVFELAAELGFDSSTAFPETLDDEHPFVLSAKFGWKGILSDELEHSHPEVWRKFEERGFARVVSLIMPIHADGRFFGFLLLGSRKDHRVFSSHDIASLESVCLQLGLHMRARQIERRANQAEKLISLGTLAAGLAHELRNPLVSIKTFSQLLGENANDLDFQREFSSTVLRDVGRIESIVENVAAFATDRKVPFSWIRLEEVVRAGYAIVKPSFDAGGVRYVIEHGELPHVRGNHNQLTQIVINLLNNAVQAFKGQSDPCVTVRIRHRATEASKAAVEMTVSDNGSGVDPEILPRLFEPFTTTKDHGDRERKAGMGLGLAIVKRIVDGHSGVIRVDTEKGRGTTFTVVLPCEGEAE